MRKERMCKRGRLFVALAAAAAVVAALPALGAAAKPIPQTMPGQLCGIQGTWVNTETNDSTRQLANGVTISHFHGSSIFTSAATGKGIEFLSTSTDKSDPTLVDNGDGTYSIVTVHSGSGIVIKVSNGPTLATNAGAGHFISEDVWKMPAGGLAAANPAVDEYVTFRMTRVGGRTTSDGGDFCGDLVIPALT
jgi:hypothetical protein